MSAPPLASRVEVRLGLAFWIVAGTASALRGAFFEWLPYAAPVVGLACLWPFVSRRRWANPVLDWLPLPFVVLTYEMLHRVVPACWRGTIDAPLAAADRALLGRDAGVLLEPFVARPLTVAMACAYAAYYVLPVSLAVWLWLRRSRTAFRELVAGEVGALFIGYLGYLFLPTMGPGVWLPASTFHVALDGDFIGPLIRSLNENHHGAFPRDAFPSLHTANAVTILLVTWKHDRRALAVYLVPCIALVLATVYLRFHYAVDVLAGAALAIVWQTAVPRLVARETPAKTDGAKADLVS